MYIPVEAIESVIGEDVEGWTRMHNMFIINYYCVVINVQHSKWV